MSSDDEHTTGREREKTHHGIETRAPGGHRGRPGGREREKTHHGIETPKNPVVTEELREWRGRAIPLEGNQIFDVVDDLQRQYINVEVEVAFDRRSYAGAQSRDSKRFHVGGVRNEDAADYHLYITNLPRDEFLPRDLATLYRCRWEVELLFRELKTQYELDEFNTSKKHVVEILVYAALLSLVVSRDLLDLVTEVADDEPVHPF